MGTGDSAFGPALDTGQNPVEVAADIVSRFFPEFREILQIGIERGFGNAMRAQSQLAGASPAAFGASALFSPQNVGVNFGNYLNAQAIGGAMRPAQQAVNEAAFDQRALWQRMFHLQDRDDAQGHADRLAQQRFNLTNIASNFVFNQSQPRQMMAGLQEAGLYMGGGFGAAAGVNAGIANMSEAFATSFLASQLGPAEGRFLLNGQDAGRVMAEMARTGGIQPGMSTDALMDQYRNADRAVYAMGNIFQGSALQRVDQANRLVGADYLQTFGQYGAGMMQDLAATGRVTGFTPQQLVSFAGMSTQLSERFGMDPFGAIGNAQVTAEYLGTFRQSGVGSAFIREPRFRETVLRRVAGAQEGRLSRDISGAYAMIAGPGGENTAAADAFVQSLEGGGRLTADGILSRLNQMEGFGDVNAISLRNASYTAAGQQARARGVGTRAALASNISTIEADRRGMLERRLRGMGMDVEPVLMELEEAGGAITQASVRSAMENLGMAGASLDNFVGGFTRGLEIQARALNMGNSAEVDALITTSRNTRRMGNIRDRTGRLVDMENMFQGRGAFAGFRNLQRLFRSRETLGTGFRDIFGMLVGDTNLSQTEIAGVVGRNVQDAAERIEAMTTDQEATEEEREQATLAQLGMGAAFQGALYGTIEGEAISMEVQNELKGILADPSKQDIATYTGVFNRFMGGREAGRRALAGKEAEALRMTALPTEKKARLKAMANERDIAMMSLENKSFLEKGLENLTGETRTRFEEALQMQQLIVEENSDRSAKEVSKMLQYETEAGGFMSMRDVERYKRQISREDPELSVSGAGSDSLIQQLVDMVTGIVQDGIKLNPGTK